ncbi:HNH endonuclease signature motif containing protein [Nocardioides sp.]|uniref:HNH endonuclease signature motif containing protein n=1 Tax=Nocardioides sp. TaxID=35761 RepID=UPI001A31DC8A|nr:HNH endonuclease signature motif containing protein [Nocardioides sp.]MBJ7356183.1 DUF222 domain-containing protein [Nocardioides sp.]
MTEIATPPAHRVGAAISAAREALGSVAGERPWSMTAAQTERALDDIAALEAQTAEAKARLLTHAETLGLPAELGARSVAVLLARRHRTSRPEAHRQARLAAGLEAHPVTAAALSQARVNPEQALVIIAGVDALPADLEAEVKVRAEEHLVELAADHDPKALKGLARTILEVVAPEVADARLAAQLERLERDAEEANRFRIWETPQGRVKGDFDLDGYSGAALKKALFAHAAPRHRAAQGPLGERLPTAERLGEAFAEYVRRYPADKLPNAGGLNATVVVLMSYETLLGDLKAAKLDTGEHISADLARRIACEAGIIPAVLGGRSQVLDLGRSRRFHSRAQRIKATIEQGGCLEEGCDAPPAFTHMHHPTEWSKGGHTDGDGWMLCPSAHRRIHDPRYTYERLPNGKIRFHRRE